MSAVPDEPAPASARLFLALCPGPQVQAAVETHAQGWHWNADAARYAPADWHVTLHFIGAVQRTIRWRTRTYRVRSDDDFAPVR